MGQCLIFQCLSFPFTISPCKWPTPLVLFLTPVLELGVTRHTTLPHFSKSPRAICEGCAIRTGPNSCYSPMSHWDPQPTCWFPTSPLLLQPQGLLPRSPRSVCCLQASSSFSFILHAQETDVSVAPSLPSQHPQSRRGQRRVATISTHSGHWGAGARWWAWLGQEPEGSGRDLCSATGM